MHAMPGVSTPLSRQLVAVGLCGLLTAVAVSTFVTAPARAKRAVSPPRVAYRQIAVARVLVLPTGRVMRTFDFSIRGDYADLVVLDVPAGAAVSVRALPANGMQIVGTTTRAGGDVCRRRGSRVVCTQGLEWCGLIEGSWRATVRKTSQGAALVRVRLIFVRRAEPGSASAL